MITEVTNISATEPGRGLAKKRSARFIVKFNGVPCALVPYPRLFGTKLVPKRGVLVPNDRIPTEFPGEKSANKAIDRAIRLKKTLHSAVFELPEIYRPFAEDGVFKVEART